jgi:hypothetical protein
MTYDPKAEARSLMHKQKVLCNGQANGKPCRYYWTMIRIVPSHNPDFLKLGEKLRFCRAWGAEPLEFGEGTTELAISCSMYEPDKKRKFDSKFEEYMPMTEDEAKQAGISAPPVGIGISSTTSTSTSVFSADDAIQESSNDG